MPLPSQTARSSGPRSFGGRRPRNLKPLAVGAAAVALVAAGIWGISKLGGSSDNPLGPKPAGAQGNTPALPTNGQIAGLKAGASTNPPGATPTTLAAQPPKSEPPALELRQGRTRPEAAIPAKNPPTPPLASNPSPANPPVPAPSTPPAVVTEPLRAGSPGAAPVAPAPTLNPSMTAGLAADLQAMITDGFQKIASADPVGARMVLSQAMMDPRLPEQDRAELRTQLSKLNEDLVFSPRVVQGDPSVLTHVVASNENLVKINQKNALGPDWRLIQRINRMSDPNRLSLGQKLKLVRGPFHGVVTKSAYRFDLWMGPTDQPNQWVYVRSFTVGLGEQGSTPVGTFIVKKGSKLVNPPWTNPRTGEHFDGGDPKNPIGKFWIGLEGTGDASTFTGYGIHGTIEPESIGQQRSMGCIRLGADDVALVYELMGETLSTVKVQP